VLAAARAGRESGHAARAESVAARALLDARRCDAKNGTTTAVAAQGNLRDAKVRLQVARAAADAAAEGRRFADAVRQRFETGQVHRALGIATWLSMTATVGLGFVQYYNLYGIGAGQDDNPCARGTAVFGQEQCWGTPLPHLAAAMTTSALYLATLSMSIGLLTNDPNEALSGTGSYSDRMRAHSVLALIHLAGMLAQSVIGVGLTNGWFGDRANDYESLQTVAVVHQVVGWTTWGALGVAGALMLF
jgi:hypothetical protein